jgi:hypothetical protein
MVRQDTKRLSQIGRNPMLAIQLVMPSEGDMALLSQDGGTILLQPIFYGNECAGPHLRVVDVTVKDGKPTTEITIKERFRLRIKPDGKLELKRGLTAETGAQP